MGRTDMHSSDSMRACVLADVARLEVRDVPRPRTGPHDVLVRIEAVGLCGTDFHIYAGHANYHTDERGQVVPLSEGPQILGHEMTGRVEEAGAAVRDLRPGDRVVIDQGINCASARRSPFCEYCASGDSHQCQFYEEHGITGRPGGLAEYIAVPAVNAVAVAAGLERAPAALTEPLGCIVHSSEAVERACGRYRVGAREAERRVRSVLVCGAGPAGLLFTQYLRRVLGFDGLLMVSEPNARRRALAERFGAEAIDPRAVDLVEAVQEKTGGRRVEYLIEAAGVGHIFTLMPGLIRKQATVLLYGHGQTGTDLGVLNNVQFMEPTLVAPVGASGGFETDGRPSTYARSLKLIEGGRIEVAPIITHRYTSLDEVPDAFSSGDKHAPDYVKAVVEL